MSDISLISPYGGSLIDLLAPQEEVGAMRQEAVYLPSITLSTRSMLDLELLAVGAFSPLTTFMGKSDYESVRDHMRLRNGTCFPMPITLPIDNWGNVKEGQYVVLKSPTNEYIARLFIQEIFAWDWKKEAREVFGTTNLDHPVVREMKSWGRVCISGQLQVLYLPPRYDFPSLYGTPKKVRMRLKQFGKSKVIAFQTRNPLHRGHEKMIAEVLQMGTVLLHPVTGMTNAHDIDAIARIHSYQWMDDHVFDHRRVLLQLIPLAMRMAGPREAVWHTIIRRNYGASHLIVGRDHASPGPGYYAPFAAQKLAISYAPQTGVTIVPFDEIVYVPKRRHFVQKRMLSQGDRFLRISATKIRRLTRFSSWAIRPQIARIVQAKRRKLRKGYCLWFTGLPSSGKSTIANLLATMLHYYGYQVVRLDGDAIRQADSHALGFSKADRDRQVLRVGRMAKKIVKGGRIAICSLVSPYEATRQKVRDSIGRERFIEIYIATPIRICEKRDTKLLFLRSRAGLIKQLTGIDDPYEVPRRPTLRLFTTQTSLEKNISIILAYLKKRDFFSEA